jgi:hypothetical protein
MPLFKEPDFDPKRMADHAQARISGHGDRHNVMLTAFLVPLIGALVAIVVAAYALTRPGVAERLRQRPEPPTTLEVDLE